jgi:hypothetical protein
MNRRKLILSILTIVVAGAAIYVGNWFVEREKRLSPADPAALEALESTPTVTVTRGDWFVFEPANASPTTGFIFYPGGECDERGYAEPLRAIAAAGFLVVLVPMPLQLAVLAPGKAADVIAAYPGIERWAIGGHSLGGAMAARFVHRNPGQIDGLLLWDAYPPETDDLSGRELKVRLIHRSDESGTLPENYVRYMPNLPAHTDYRPVTGANHINFGRFIPAARFSEDVARGKIPVEQQHRLIVEHSVDFLRSL